MNKKPRSVTLKLKDVVYQDETKIHPVLSEYFGYSLYKANAWFRLLQNDALKMYDMQTFHLGILKVLEVSGPKSQIELGDELGIDKASMVKLIDHLESKKLVERHGHLTDRRIKSIVLTKNAKQLIKMCSQARGKVEKEFFKKLSTSEEKTFRRLVGMVLPERKGSKTV